MMSERLIIAFGYHDQTAPRHYNLCKEYRSLGYEILECHTDARGLWGKYIDLWKKCKKESRIRNQELGILVMFPGHYLVPLAWFLTRFPRRTLIFDAFISLYDTLVEDRRRISRWNPYAWFLWFTDFLTCHLADEVLIDTEEHKKYFVKTFWLNPKRIRVIYLGTREDLFKPSPYLPAIAPPNGAKAGPSPQEGRGNSKEILFYGTYLPLQGVEHIIEAARILQDSNPDTHFTLIGSGQTYREIRALADSYNLHNITFEDRVPFERLPERIRAANLCLGIFGTTGKAQRVIPHKVYDAVGCGTPIITADTPAIWEKFANHPKVIFCEAGNPEDLAQKISIFFADTKNSNSSIN